MFKKMFRAYVYIVSVLAGFETGVITCWALNRYFEAVAREERNRKRTYEYTRYRREG